MGVHGLWRLIEPVGKPIPLETLENKVLAVDISIWLHQTIKGFQDSKGAPIPNAHLLGIFHRVCKLLYYGIHPIFVFDGGIPMLKKQLIAKRNQLKLKNINDENILRKRLLNNLLKYSAINVVISEKTEANVRNNTQETDDKIQNDIFHLPDSQLESVDSSSDEEYTSGTEYSNPMATLDLHTIDEKSTHFKSLPADVRHEILTELKDTRKQSSWGKIHELPTQSDDFAIYQMKRLLKRYSVQMSLEEAEKEMGGHTLSLGELEILLNDNGVITSKSVIENRILADESKRYFYLKNIKEVAEQTSTLKNADDDHLNNNSFQKESPCKKLKADLEYENDLKEAIKLSLEDEAKTSNNKQVVDNTKVLEENENFNNDLSNIPESQFSIELPENIPTTSKKILSNESCDSDLNDVTSQYKSINKSLTSAKKNMSEFSAITATETSFLTDADTSSALNSNIDIFHKYPSTFTNGKFPLASKTMNCKENDNFIRDNISNNNNNFKAKDDDVSLQVFDAHDLKQANLNINKSESNNLKKYKKSSNVETISESDSEDDFLEVQMPSEYEYEEQISKKISDIGKQALQITIEKCTKLDDDLFSDIFHENQKFQNKPLKSQSVQQCSTQKSTNICTDSGNKEKESEGKATEALINNDTVTISQVTENNKEGSVLLEEILKPLNENRQLVTSKLEDLRNKLVNEADQLIAEKSNKERLATNITEQMYYEVQELLQLFGLPYVIAPMEAEAQCAFLNQINLTDGTITDDSDIWLFGGKTVYKNFFNQNKHVLEFQAENIQNAFSLSRYEMILLALLVGSDYTTGVQGIGPVTAVEILAAFPPTKTELSINQINLISGLKEFRKWLTSSNTKSTRISLKNKLKNTELPPQFPSLQVVQAYLEPAVDASAEPFSWGKPDACSLVNFSKEKFGWNQKKSEEILKPVIKRMEETTIQKKITDYFRTKHKIEVDLISNKMSKRVKKAVTKMGANETDSCSSSDSTIKMRTRNQESKKKTKEKNDDVKLLKLTKNLSRKRAKEIKIELNEMLLREESSKAENSSTRSTFITENTHRNEVIPQKQRDESDSLKRKLKAIEIFRKSKHGPGFVKKRRKVSNEPKEDAELSENSDS